MNSPLKTAIDAPVILLMGPTASGKTALSLDLAESLNGEIISVDSALVYRGMDIGTAKPTLVERRGIPHHLIDILDPTEVFSAGEFRSTAVNLIQEIQHRGKVPILTGGTMLYFHSLLHGIAVLPTADVEVREQLAEDLKDLGLDRLHQELQRVDPEAAERIHPHDPQRIVRALEVYRSTGTTQSDWLRQQQSEQLPFEPIKLVVAPESRETLHLHIADRFDRMLQQGLIEEVQALRDRGDLSADMPSIRCVGYRQVWRYLAGAWSYETMRDKAIVATRQLAKRQYTWLRKQADVHRLFSESHALLSEALTAIQMVKPVQNQIRL